MKNKYINDISTGDNLKKFVAVVKNINSKKTTTGAEFKDLTLSDNSGEINAKIWADNLDACEEVTIGDVISLDGTVDSFKGAIQLHIKSLEKVPVDKIELTDFVASYDGDLNALYSQINHYVKSVGNKFLKELLDVFFGDEKFKKKFKLNPGAQFIHHAFLGGLMRHLYEMLQLMDRVCELYPAINRDLLITGILLHDIGKMDELETSTSITRTNIGKLVGHITISSLKTDKAMAKIKNFPLELRNHVLHLILSHHGELSFGSPVKPMTSEALALHYIDQLSSKLDIINTQTQNNIDQPGTFTGKVFALDGEVYIPDYNDMQSAEEHQLKEQKLF